MVQLGIKNDVAKLQQLLGSKLYSNKYSFISEALQNSTDAMRKCGKGDQSFDVGIKIGEDRGYVFYLRDYGCSFESIEDFKRLVGTLLESSKTQVKDGSEGQELGKYGIGSIAVAAYQKEWHYKVYKNGKGFDAKLQEIEGKGLFMTCGEYYDSQEVDGVYLEVKVSDASKFVTALLEKAKYFQNIKFYFCPEVIELLRYEYSTGYLLTINDNFQIYKSEDFQYSTLNQLRELHICMDQYSYLINWNTLGINAINIPFALRFNLDDFETNPTREVLTIDDTYKDKILDKIKKLANWLLDKYNEENPVFEANSLKQFQYELNRRQDKIVKVADEPINIFQICHDYVEEGFKFNEPTYHEVTIENLKVFRRFMNKYWIVLYEPKATIRHGRSSRPSYSNYKDENIFLLEKSLKKTYKDYLVRQGGEYYFLKKKDYNFSFLKDNTTKSTSNIFYEVFKEFVPQDCGEYELELYKKEYDRLVFLLNDFEKSVFSTVESLIPADYIASLPKKEKKKKNTGKLVKTDAEIVLKYPRITEKYISWDAVWVDHLATIGGLHKLPKLHIYGTETNRRELELIFSKFQRKTNNVMAVMVTEKTDKLIKEEKPQNFIHINDLKERFTVLSKYTTASFIKNGFDKYKFVLENTELIKKYISTELAKDLQEINGYLSNYDVDDVFNSYKTESADIINEIVTLYKANPKMYNMSMMALYNKVKVPVEKLDFLYLFAQDINKMNTSYGVEKGALALKTTRELCKARLLRMDFGNYNFDQINSFFGKIEELELETA